MKNKVKLRNRLNIRVLTVLLIFFIVIAVVVSLINQRNIRITYEDYFTQRVLQTNALMAAYIDEIGDISYYVDLLREQDDEFKQRQIRYSNDREELFRLQESGASEDEMREITDRMAGFRRETEQFKDEEYWDIITGLKALKESSMSTYIYILADTGLPQVNGARYYSFVFDADDTYASVDIFTDGLGTCTEGEDYLTMTIDRKKQMEHIEYYDGIYGELYYAYAPIFDNNGDVIAVLGTDLELRHMNEMISSSTRLFNTFFIVFTVITIIFIFTYLTVRIIRPLNSLTDTAHEITGGNRDISVPEKALKEKTEIGVLAHALKEAIDENKKSINHLEYIFNNISAMVCVTDPETDTILFINDEMKNNLNVSDNYNQLKCYKALHNLDERCDNCPCDKLDLDPGKEVLWEQNHQASNRVFRSISKYVRWPNGKVVHIQHAVDITDMKNMQDDLQSQNIRLNLIINSMNIALWDADADNSAKSLLEPEIDIVFSEKFINMLGFKDNSEFPGKLQSWFERVHPIDVDRVVGNLMACIEDKTNKTSFDAEYRMKLKNGQYKWFRGVGAMLRDSDGNPVHMIGAIEDINERKEAERKIFEKSEINQVLFDNAPIGLIIFDRNHLFIDCNDNTLRLFGCDKAAMTRNFNIDLHSPDNQPDGSKSRDKADDLINRVFGGEIIKTDWMHYTADGQPLPVELTLTKIKQDDKYVVLGYLYDMREQVKLKNEIEIALRKAESANQAKSIFLANMSHEIRTPMNAILGITEIELHKDTLPADTADALSKIYDSGDLLLNIINDILDFSKIEEGKLELVPVDYNLPGLINETVQMNLMRYDNKLIEFILDVDENTPLSLRGDTLRIKQILNNLLSNAFKYTEKGQIRMSVSAKLRDNSVYENDTILIVNVSDTGRGMTSRQIEKLFKEYTRFNMYINRNVPGTGLGMSITKRLIDMMGGEITVVSELNKGTMFTVHLPQKRTNDFICGSEVAAQLHDFNFHKKPVSKEKRIAKEHMGHGKVLIVDDIESNIYVAKGMLTPYKLQIDTTTSGIDAIEKIKNGEVYDIIFMDYMMPRMNGMEATKILRDMGYKNAIVALTANALTGQAEIFLQNGFDAFVSKPIDSRELNIVLKRFIQDSEDGVSSAADKQSRLSPGDPDTVSKPPVKEKQISELEQFFIMDAHNALMTLDGLSLKLNDLNEAELNDYEITVHGMKSALYNIGEKELSNEALELEKAAAAKNITYIAAGTPAFTAKLKALTERLESGQ